MVISLVFRSLRKIIPAGWVNLRVATDGLEAAEAGGVGWWVGTAIGGQLAPPEYHGWW